MVITQMVGDGGLKQCGGSWGGTGWPNSEYTLKKEPTRFAERPNVEHKMTFSFYPEQSGRMEFLLTEVGKNVGGVCLEGGYQKLSFRHVKFEASSVFLFVGIFPSVNMWLFFSIIKKKKTLQPIALQPLHHFSPYCKTPLQRLFLSILAALSSFFHTN